MEKDLNTVNSPSFGTNIKIQIKPWLISCLSNTQYFDNVFLRTGMSIYYFIEELQNNSHILNTK